MLMMNRNPATNIDNRKAGMKKPWWSYSYTLTEKKHPTGEGGFLFTINSMKVQFANYEPSNFSAGSSFEGDLEKN